MRCVQCTAVHATTQEAHPAVCHPGRGRVGPRENEPLSPHSASGSGIVNVVSLCVCESSVLGGSKDESERGCLFNYRPANLGCCAVDLSRRRPGVVVFQGRASTPTYATRPGLLDKHTSCDGAHYVDGNLCFRLCTVLIGAPATSQRGLDLLLSKKSSGLWANLKLWGQRSVEE